MALPPPCQKGARLLGKTQICPASAIPHSLQMSSSRLLSLLKLLHEGFKAPATNQGAAHRLWDVAYEFRTVVGELDHPANPAEVTGCVLFPLNFWLPEVARLAPRPT